MLACSSRLGQPTYVATLTVGQGLKACLSFFLFVKHFHPIPQSAFGGGSPLRAHASRVELFLYGKLRLIAVLGLGLIQWRPCSGAPPPPRFLN